MADALYELLQPHLRDEGSQDSSIPGVSNPVTSKYLSRLSRLDIAALQTTEPQSLAQASHSTLLALQSLASRSSKSLIASSDHLGKLSHQLPSIKTYGHEVRSGVQTLDSRAAAFSTKYSRSSENHSELLERRKRALLLSRNIDRVGDILELPTLLSSAVSSAAAGAAAAGAGAATTGSGSGSATSAANISATYNAALDLHGHIKRLITLYPESSIVRDMSREATIAMQEMTTSLMQTLKSNSLKLAGGMRTIGWLRRVAPELAVTNQAAAGSQARSLAVASGDEEGAFGALFLVCRLSNLLSMLEALEPLKDLADQETARRLESRPGKGDSTGHQTERYLKRFIELFREQSFAIVSMFRSIFPAESDAAVDDFGLDLDKMGLTGADPAVKATRAEPLPSALATFPLHLVENVLMPTLQEYLPNVGDRSARESLLTQVLYCAGSLGRLGGDFTVLLTSLYDPEDEDEDDAGDAGDEKLTEWVDIVKKHRVQAARLESLAASGGGPARPKGITT